MQNIIEFRESQSTWYKIRTKENVELADITLLLTKVDSPGIKLTRRLAIEKAKRTQKVVLAEYALDDPLLLSKLNKLLHDTAALYPQLKINVAGNGLDKLSPWYNQEQLDKKLLTILATIFANPRVVQVNSGGQTGVDEIGLKAAILAKKFNPDLKIICIAPKGYRFRNEHGVDIWSETLFKKRFQKFIDYTQEALKNHE